MQNEQDVAELLDSDGVVVVGTMAGGYAAIARESGQASEYIEFEVASVVERRNPFEMLSQHGD